MHAPNRENPMPAVPHPPYENLTPERVLDAVESLGYQCDGRFIALNS